MTHRSHKFWILHHALHHILHVRTLHHILEHAWIARHLLHQVLHCRSLKHTVHLISTISPETIQPLHKIVNQSLLLKGRCLALAISYKEETVF